MNRSSLKAFRRFVSAVLAASPRDVTLSVVALLLLSLTEGIGVLLLFPLLALVGVDTGVGLGELRRGLSKAFSTAGIRPTLPAVLALYVGIAIVQSWVQRWQTTLNVTVQHEFGR